MKYAVAIDIGGTNTRVALIDEELNMLENILEEQGEARRFTKEEEKKIRIYKKP